MYTFLYKALPDTRYDLKFNVSVGRTLYANKEYTAIMCWSRRGYSIIDFEVKGKTGLWQRNVQWLDEKKGRIEGIVGLNCWDILYLYENREAHREDVMDALNLLEVENE